MPREAEAKKIPAKYIFASSVTTFSTAKITAIKVFMEIMVRLLILLERYRFGDNGLFAAGSGANIIVNIAEKAETKAYVNLYHVNSYDANAASKNINDVTQ